MLLAFFPGYILLAGAEDQPRKRVSQDQFLSV